MRETETQRQKVREKLQINYNEKDITTDNKNSKWLYANKLESLEEMDKFVNKYKYTYQNSVFFT
jgi:hypothetical protein